MKIVYYYQTFCGLQKVIDDSNNNITHIHLSSIHFDVDDIHLNDYSPYDERFESVWDDLDILRQKKDINTILMIGGAGGAFQQMFTDFDKYYKMVYTLITSKKNLIKGVDLDIEEEVDINDIIKLILRFKSDFGLDFIISMTPIQSSLQTDNSGMGGFVYKHLYNKLGNLIDYFNVQCYGDYSIDCIKSIVKNGYPVEKINMGMMSYQYNVTIPDIIKEIIKLYPHFGGVYDWEYNDAVPNWNHLIDVNKVHLVNYD